jgi:hypothetical protein
MKKPKDKFTRTSVHKHCTNEWTASRFGRFNSGLFLGVGADKVKK